MVTTTEEQDRKVTTYVPADLWQRARMQALQRGITVSELVKQALMKELDGKPRK